MVMTLIDRVPTTWQVTRLEPALGAEVRGLSLVDASAETADAVQALLTEHHVLFFPDQHLDIDQHVAFGRHFGPHGAAPAPAQRLPRPPRGVRVGGVEGRHR